MVKRHIIEWPSNDIKGAIESGFSFIEKMDHIVGYLYTSPNLAKKITLLAPDEVKFDFIPEGLGFIRTAYFKIRPDVRQNEIIFENQDKNLKLRIFLVA